MQTNIQTIQTVIDDLKSPTQYQTPQLASAIATGEQFLQQVNGHVAQLQSLSAQAQKRLQNAEALGEQAKADIAKLTAAAQAAIAPVAPAAS